MIGAKWFADTGNGVSFRFAGRASTGNHVTIELDGSDEYTVRFHYARGTDVRLVRECTRIQSGGLRELFEEQTQLRLSLGTMGA